MFSPRMQSVVKDSLEQALRSSRSEAREVEHSRRLYYQMKREDYCYNVIEVIDFFSSVLWFRTLLIFINILSSKLLSVDESENFTYKGGYHE